MGDQTELTRAIVTRELTKRYGNVVALDDVSLSVPIGSVYGFLGPNGAGKTTVIRLLLGFIKPTSGEAEIFGEHCWRRGVEARKHVGFLVPSTALYPDMSGLSLLDYTSKLSGQPPVLRDDLLDLLELPPDDLRRRFREYSKGMKQKLALVCAAQHDPSILILDEPTDGLDPVIRRRFETFLSDFNARGRTIFMSSHDLAEVERVCDIVAVVKQGSLVREAQVGQFREMQVRTADIVFASHIPDGIENLGTILRIDPHAARVQLQVDGDTNQLIRYLSNHDVSDLKISAPRLDEVFLSYYEPNGQPTEADLDEKPAVSATKRIR